MPPYYECTGKENERGIRGVGGRLAAASHRPSSDMSSTWLQLSQSPPCSCIMFGRETDPEGSDWWQGAETEPVKPSTKFTSLGVKNFICKRPFLWLRVDSGGLILRTGKTLACDAGFLIVQGDLTKQVVKCDI